MTVDHTKFDVDRFFGVLLHYLVHRSTVLNPDEFASACNRSREGKFGVVMPFNWMRDYKKLEHYTKPFKYMRKRFSYEILITARFDDNQKRRVYVSVKRTPSCEPETEEHFLKNIELLFPSLDNIDEFPKMYRH